MITLALAVLAAAPFAGSLTSLEGFDLRYAPERSAALLQRLPAAYGIPTGLELRELKRIDGVVRVEQTHLGYPVFGADGALELTPDGRLSRLQHHFVTVGALPSLEIGAALAADLAFRKVGKIDLSRLAGAEVHPELGIVVGRQGARLAYRIPVLTWNLTDRLEAYVDATSGEVLFERNLAVQATTHRVFNTNPGESSGALVSRPFETSLPALGSDPSFEGALIDANNCNWATVDASSIANSEVIFYVLPIPPEYQAMVEQYLGKKIENLVLPICKEEPRANPAATHTPVSDESSPAALTDTFSEVNFYYHANRVAQWYRSAAPDGLGAGFAGRGAKDPLFGTVNFRMPNYLSVLCTSVNYVPPGTVNAANVHNKAALAFLQRSNADVTVGGFVRPCAGLPSGQPTTEDFQAFDNAFFLPATDTSKLGLPAELGNLRSFDSMVFGQGTVDMAYDGNVVYHEYTHGIVGFLGALQDGVAYDATGTDFAPGAMNEGLADYFASVIAGDACLGEYAANIMNPGNPPACMRSLVNTARCPESLIGEVHHDSHAFSAALWQIREGEKAQGRAGAFDIAVFKALRGMLAASQFSDFNHRLLDELHSAGLDEAEAEEILTAKNVLDCERVITLEPGDGSTRVNLPGQQDGVGDFSPGIVQYRIAVPKLTAKVKLTLVNVEQSGGPIPGIDLGSLGVEQEELDVRLLLEKTSRIDLGGAPYSVPATTQEVTLKFGSGKTSGGLTKTTGTAEVELDDEEGGDWTIVVANYNRAGHQIEGVKLEVTGELPEPVKPTPPTPPLDTTTTTNTSSTTLLTPSVEKKGCACANAASASSASAWGLLLPFGIYAVRRRRRGGGGRCRCDDGWHGLRRARDPALTSRCGNAHD